MTYSVLRKILLGLTLVSVLAACDRAKEDTSKLKLVLPMGPSQNKVDAMNAAQLVHLVLNVRGEGIPAPIVFTWDACQNDCTNILPPPASFVLDVPSGNNRMVQVLAVYMSSATSSEFYYGDTTQSLFKSEESVVISLNSFAKGINISGSGRVGGRYLTADGQGPTGEMYVRYTPPGKPGIIMQKAQMVAGWFKAFALDDVAFDYVMASGQMILPQFKMSTAAVSDQVAKVMFPSTYERMHYNFVNGVEVPSFDDEKGSTNVIGFFGPGSIAKTVCYDNINYEFTNFSKAASIGAQRLTFATGTISNDNQIVISGGTDVCSGGPLFEEMLVVTPISIDDAGRDGIFSFRAAFIDIPINNSPLDILPPVDMVDRFRFDYIIQPLPGVVDAGVNRIALYKHTAAQKLQFRDDMPPCIAFAQNQISGVTKLGEKDLATPEGSFEISKSEVSNSDIYVCALRGGVAIPMGFVVDRNQLNQYNNCTNCGHQGGAPIALALEMSWDKSAYVKQGQCVPFSIYPLDSKLMETRFSSTAALTFRVGRGMGYQQMYSAADCNSNSMINTSNYELDGGIAEIYMKFDDAVSTNFNLNIVDISGSPSGITGGGVSITVVSGTDRYLEVRAMRDIQAGHCIEVEASIKSLNGMDYAPTADIDFNLSTSPTASAIFQDNLCSSAIGSITIPANVSTKSFFIKAPMNLADDRFRIDISNFSDSSIKPSYIKFYVRNDANTTVHKVSLVNNDNQRPVNDCRPFTFSLVNNFGTLIQNGSSNLPFQILSTASGTGTLNFYSDSGCITTPLLDQFNFRLVLLEKSSMRSQQMLHLILLKQALQPIHFRMMDTLYISIQAVAIAMAVELQITMNSPIFSTVEFLNSIQGCVILFSSRS
jgi:hypothetical protein